MDTKTDDKYILAERYNLRQYYNRINESSSLKEEHYCRANEKTGLISYISKSLDTETHKIYTKKSMILITRKQQKQMLLF